MEVKLHTARTLVGRLRGAAAVRDASATAAAVSELRRASKDDPEVRVPLADAGAVPFLASQSSGARPRTTRRWASLWPTRGPSRSWPPSSRPPPRPPPPRTPRPRCSTSPSRRGSQLMSSPSILDALAAAMRAEEYAAVHHAAATVASLLCVDAYRPIVGAKRPLLAALVALLCGGGRGTRATKDALKALFGVALYPLNRAALVDLGAVRALFSLVMTDGRTGIVEDASAVLAQVAGCAESLAAFAGVSGVRILVDLVEPGGAATERARENAASALLNLVMVGGERAVAQVLAVGGTEEVVRELAEDGAASPRGKAKAGSLLRALEEGAAVAKRQREHRFPDFLDGLVESDPYFSSPASATTHDDGSCLTFR